MSSYVFTEQHNFQTVLWAVASATYRMVRTIRQLPTMTLPTCLWLYTLLVTVWPDVACLVASGVKVAGVTLALAGGVAALAFLPVELFVGLAIVGVYAVVFFPRKAVRPC